MSSSNSAFESGQRFFSPSSPACSAARSRSSSVASSVADSLRISTSILTEIGIEFTLVPPSTRPILNVVFGDFGTSISAIRAIARPIACAGFGIPNAP